MTQTHAIVVSAGKGVRMNRSTPKQYLLLQGMPVVCHTILAFNACPHVDDMVLVVPEEDVLSFRESLLSGLTIDKPLHVVAGGERRQDSVYNGLMSLAPGDDIVVIHDGVRPLIRPEMISRCVQKAAVAGACILGVPLQDTLKKVNRDGTIRETLFREGLWLVQTPQAFRYRLIVDAYETGVKEGVRVTDDAALVERMGTPVSVSRGSPTNLKITTPEDLLLAEALLSRIGLEKRDCSEPKY